jgi:hypothetical protein
VAAQQAEIAAKTKVTNYVKHPKTGLRAVGPNYTAKEGDKLVGFTIGNSGTLNYFQDEDKMKINLYEDPSNPTGPLITQEQYNNRRISTPSIDTGDGKPTYETKPLGQLIAQKSPADGTVVNVPGYVHPSLRKGPEEIQYGIRVKGVFTPVKEGQTATHERKITKNVKGEITSTGDIKKIETADKVTKKFTRYFDAKGTNVGTDLSKATQFQNITTVDGVETEVSEFKPYERKEGKTETVQVFIDKEGKDTIDRTKAVKVRLDKVNSDGKVIEYGEEKDYKLVQQAEKTKTIQYLMKSVKNPDQQVKMSEEEAFAAQNAGTHVKVGSRVLENGKPTTAFKEMPASLMLDAIKESEQDKDVVATIQGFSSGEKRFGKVVPDGFKIYRQQKAPDRLLSFSIFLKDHPNYVDQINSNGMLRGKVRTFLTNTLARYFTGEPVGVSDKGVTIFSRTNPKSPTSAINEVASKFAPFMKLEDIMLISTEASKTADLKSISQLLPPKNDQVNIPPVRNTVTGKDGEFKGTLTSTVSVNKKYDGIIKKLSTIIGRKEAPENIGLNIERIINYEVDPITKKIKVETLGDGKGGLQRRPITTDDQPALDFILQLDQTILGRKLGNREATFLDAFMAMISPYPKLHPLGQINKQVRDEITDDFALLVSYDDKKAMDLLQALTSRNTQATNNIMEEFYGKDFSQKQVREDAKAKSESAYNAMTTIDMMVETYYEEDGKFIDINALQGDAVVFTVGGVQTIKKYLKAIPVLFRGGNVLDVISTPASELSNSLINQNLEYDSVDPTNEKEIAARKRNGERFEQIKGVIDGTVGVTDFIKRLDKKTQASLKGERSADIIRKLAIRQYHKYMLAYQLAAAIQGGTGGRTISDQDVENIMRSLNYGFFTPAALEVATLNEARKMMEKIYTYNEAIQNPDTSVVFSALKARQFLKDKERRNLLGKIRRRNSSSLLAKVADRRKYIIPRLKNIQKFNGYDEKQTNNVVSDYGIQKQQELEKFIKRDD